MQNQHETFKEFYQTYLLDHADPSCRKVHFVAFLFYVICVGIGIYQKNWWLVLVGLVVGYGLAWVSHLIFEKNRPTTFGKPYWSMRAGRRMFLELLIGRIDMSKRWKKNTL